MDDLFLRAELLLRRGSACVSTEVTSPIEDDEFLLQEG